MWQIKKEELSENVVQYRIQKEDIVMSCKQWIQQMQKSDSFLELFVDALRQSEFEGYYWECRPITTSSIHQDFEFVLVRGNIFTKLTANRSAFSAYFSEEKDVVSFTNLGGDAELVVPCPISEEQAYVHLASFVRQAPQEQVRNFWRRVAKEYAAKITEQPRWLSTAGMGVYWLHIRIDSRPKYYRYSEYKKH